MNTGRRGANLIGQGIILALFLLPVLAMGVEARPDAESAAMEPTSGPDA